jgi:hypothetical protein
MRCCEEKIPLSIPRLLKMISLGVSVLRYGVVLLAVLASLVMPAHGVIIINPVTPTTLYATLNDEALYKSTDAGATWTELSAGTESVPMWRLFIAPQTPTTLYGIASQEGKNRLLKSSDGGLSWTPLLQGREEIRATTVAIDPQTPTTLYVGVSGGGLKSSDGGRTWTTLINDGPPHQTEEETTAPKGWGGYDWPLPTPVTPPLLHYTFGALASDPLPRRPFTPGPMAGCGKA